MIEYDTEVAEDTVRVGPNWRQVTPAAKNKARWYETPLHPGIKFTSVSEVLRSSWPSDFTGPAKAWVANGAWNDAEMIADWRRQYAQAVIDAGTDAYLLEQAEQFKKDKLAEIRAYADESLEQAADRGTAVHHYIEDRLNGDVPNWAEIEQAGAGPWIAAVEKFLADTTPEVVFAEVVCFDTEHEVAGTCDAIVRLHHPELGGLWELDWKSRT